MKKHLFSAIAAVLLAAILIASSALPANASGKEDTEEDPLAERLAEAQNDVRSRKAGYYGMVPIRACDVADGVYEIAVQSSSAFFKIAHAELTVSGDNMTAEIEIPSLSYRYVFPGTKEEAKAASEAEWIGYEERNEHTVFTIDVPALDFEIDCAAYSKARRKWYDRKLVFLASSLPEGTIPFALPDYELIEAAISAFDVEGAEQYLTRRRSTTTTSATGDAVGLDMPDGEYSIEVNMIGGSGRASISSPTLLIVRDGKAYARLIWSSANYDYMIVGKTTYYNITDDGGNSVFEIPITETDYPMEIVADTTAMGDPLEIEYALTFYRDTIGPKGRIPQESAKLVLLIAGAIIILGGVLNFFVKRRRKS